MADVYDIWGRVVTTVGGVISGEKVRLKFGATGQENAGLLAIEGTIAADRSQALNLFLDLRNGDLYWKTGLTPPAVFSCAGLIAAPAKMKLFLNTFANICSSRPDIDLEFQTGSCDASVVMKYTLVNPLLLTHKMGANGRDFTVIGEVVLLGYGPVLT